MNFFLLFVKAAKVMAVGTIFVPLAGACIGTGYIFGSLVRAIAYAPDQEEVMFNYAVLGFAFIETFVFMVFGGVGVVLVF
jgi:F0F1-type ATP synthase membrane subunit c/vacuolar-type H+-ATPase subunit K